MSGESGWPHDPGYRPWPPPVVPAGCGIAALMVLIPFAVVVLLAWLFFAGC